MNKSCIRIIVLSFFFLLLLVSCDNNSGNSENNPNTEPATDYAKVTFQNDTQFHVRVYRDTSVLLFDELAPGKSNTGDIRESTESHIGTTFRYSYRLKLSDPDDTFSGQPFAEGDVGDLEETFVIEKGKTYKRDIPVPENILFQNAYFRVKNNASFNVSIWRIGTTLLQLGNQELMIPSGKTGIYRIGRNDLNMNDYLLRNVEISYYFPDMTLSTGNVYDFIFTDEEATPRVINDVKWRIKPAPTSVYNELISPYRSGYFTGTQGTNLNTHLASNVRYGISDHRSNYPLSKIISSGDTLICAEQGFNFFDSQASNPDNGYPFEMAMVMAKDTEWLTNVFAPNYFYSGTISKVYQTIFNDIIKLSNNRYILLATYVKQNRTGMWLFEVNAAGQFVNETDIPPSPDMKTSFMGVKLTSLSTGGFLVTGRKKIYDDNITESFSHSEGLLYKFSNLQTQSWLKEFSEDECSLNISIDTTELTDGYIVCGYSGDGVTLTTTVKKIDKNNGNSIWQKEFAFSSNAVIPFDIISDSSNNVYISGYSSTEAGPLYAYILKLNSSGDQVWYNEYGTKARNFLFGLTLSGNSIIATGSGNTSFGDNPDFYPWMSGNGWIVKVDTGTGLLLKEIYKNDVSVINSAEEIPDGGFIFSAIKNFDNAHPYFFNTYAIKADEHLNFE